MIKGCLKKEILSIFLVTFFVLFNGNSFADEPSLEPKSIKGIYSDPDLYLKKEIILKGYLLFNFENFNNSKLYDNDEMFPKQFENFVFVEIPSWAFERKEIFNKKDVVIIGTLKKNECSQNFKCLKISDVITIVPEDDYWEVVHPDRLYLENNFPIIELTKNMEIIQEFEFFMEDAKVVIENKDIEEISALFLPDLQSKAAREINTPGSRLRWFFYNDLTGLPDYYKNYSDANFSRYLFSGVFEKKYFTPNEFGTHSGNQESLEVCFNKKGFAEIEWPETIFDLRKTSGVNYQCFPFDYFNSDEEFFFSYYFLSLLEDK